MARIIRINTSSNKTPATKNPNPTQTREYNQDYYENVYAPHFNIKDEPIDKKVIKVNSAPRITAGVTPKTSTVAKLFRPSRGGGIGGIMGNKQR